MLAFDFLQSSLCDRLPMSVPPCDSGFEQRFVFPPAAPLAKQEDDDDDDSVHPYENMKVILAEQKSRQPPKVCEFMS